MANPNFGADSYKQRRDMMSGAPSLERAPRDPNQMPMDASIWAVSGPFYFGCEAAEPAILPGFYHAGMSQRGPYLQRMSMSTDDLLRLPDPVCDMLMREFTEFWKSQHKFAGLGLAIKRGLLLWGPPGSGKTSAVQQMAAHMIRELQGIVVMVGNPSETAEALALFRRIEPNRPLICIYEDLDALVERYGEPELLAMLDGERQISGVVNVATTNYPERLDKRFVDRPGRFDRLTFVDMPHKEARAAYFAAKAVDVDEVTRARWVEATEGWSIAHLRELIVATQALGDTEADTLTRLLAMREVFADSGRPPEEDAFGRQTLATKSNRAMGFGR